MRPYVTVIGGINMDIKGCPCGQLMTATSNPGRVHISAGGVGRNIAHNLALLDIPVYLLGSVGNDSFGAHLLAEIRQTGVQVDYVRVREGQTTGTYLAILDRDHDLAVAISDMDVTTSVNHDYLAQHRDLIQHSRIVVLETNLDYDAIQTIVAFCRQAKIPYVIEPVSVAKAKKIRALSGSLDMITPNISELETLAERKLENRNDLPTVCVALRERFRHLLVTLGAEGVYHYNASEHQGQYYTALPTRVLDANGAGDAFVAGFVSGIVHEYQIDRCIRLGIAAAHFTLQSVDTVNKNVTFERCLTLI